MAWHNEKTEAGSDLVWEGADKGIAPSPHKGVANLQSVNIATESGEVMCSFARVQQNQQGNTSGTLTFLDGSHLTVSGSHLPLLAGNWVTITGSTHGGELANGTYYVSYALVASNQVQLSLYYNPTNASPISGFTAGLTASFTLAFTMAKPLASTTEIYNDGTTTQYRYYILDSNSRIWIKDTGVTTAGVDWFLPTQTALTNISGIAVLNGWLFAFSYNYIKCLPTCTLGDTTSNTSIWTSLSGDNLFGSLGGGNYMVNNGTNISHTAFVGHQGELYYCDGNYIGSIFPNTALTVGAPSINIQSYAQYVGGNTTCTFTAVFGGSLPSTGNGTVPIPVYFFTSPGGTLPNSVATTNTIKWITVNNSLKTFTVSNTAGGAAIDMSTGAVGTQFFNTFNPILASNANNYTWTAQRLNLPFFETSQSIAEIGDLAIIGCKGNVLYPWNQVDPTPGDLIPLPENNAVNLLTVNNMVYVFAGNKGNIYVTNGSTASLVTSIPDYCAGIAGTQASYIEPYFVWGGAMYLRGRVYFSILDQTSAKAGNCGGIWSFVPTQNFFIGQDIGLSLRLENQASYGTYSGVSPVLIASQNQAAISPQYWNAWYSSISNPVYGIDFTGTTPSTSAIIETDLLATGTLYNKKTFSQIEYKLSAPLVSGESVTMSYRQNITDAWATCGTVNKESVTALSGIFTIDFEKGQWLQLQASLNPVATTSSSFVRLKQIRLR